MKKIAAVAVAASLALVGCDDPSLRGTVVKRTELVGKVTGWQLRVHDGDGVEHKVNVGLTAYQSCKVGTRYPTCAGGS